MQSHYQTFSTTGTRGNILLSNLETVPGHTIIKHLGLVQGSSVRAKHVGRDIMAGLKNIFGGELKVVYRTATRIPP